MPTILVVEDEFGISEVLEAILTDSGHRVVTAMNGRQALERLHQTTPDLILLDFMMPVLDGPGMLQILASDPDHRAIPVIIMSSLPEAVVAASATGYSAFVRKPFKLKALTELIAKFLGLEAG